MDGLHMNSETIHGTASINGVELYFEVTGPRAGHPLLLIMGLGAQLTGWPVGFVDLLCAHGFMPIRFDNRDSGLSTKTAGDPPNALNLLSKALNNEPVESAYSLSDMADDAAGLLNHLGYDSAHIVGASMGGMIAQTLAIDHPESALSLTSISSATGDPLQFTPTEEALNAIIGAPLTTREDIIGANVLASRALAGPLWDENYAYEQAVNNYDRCFCPDGVAFQIGAIAMSGDRTPQLEMLSLPTLVVHGAVDPLLPLHCGTATTEAIHGSDLLVFDEMGHDLPSVYWPEVVDRIKRLTIEKDDL